MNTYGLIEKVDEKNKQILTRDLDLSFNEIADMYESEELNISPDFQRLFRWSDEQQSRFIESLILGLPIPPIYLIENNDLTFDLIDGLQRISTYLRFIGSLKDQSGKDQSKFQLTGCDLMESLNGLTFDDLPMQLRIRMKRTYVRTNIITKGSDNLLGYYMFKRLNYGGSLLSPQEIRSVNLNILDNTLIEYINELSQNQNFTHTLSILSDDKKEKQYEQELVIRYLAIKLDKENYNHQLNEYLNNFLEKVAKKEIDLHRENEKEIFEKIFSFFGKMEGENSFRKYTERNEYSGPFVVYIFEAFTIAILEYLNYIDNDCNTKENILKKIQEVKRNEDFRKLTMGAGINNPTKLNERINFVINSFNELWMK